MALNDTFDIIKARSTEAGNQQAEIVCKLEANKADKARAEADKAAALEAKDENQYKAASRAIADAEAGIEFCEICLRDVKRRQFATDEENAEVLRGLQRETDTIYTEAILSIEKALAEIVDVMDGVARKYSAIDTMARTWKEAVMKDYRPEASPFCSDRRMALTPFDGVIKTRLNTLREGKKASPLFNKGVSTND